MSRSRANQLTIPQQRFRCTECGRCCRDWHVQVSRAEVERLAGLDFPAEDELPEQLTMRLGGQTFLAHRDNGACIFLNEANNRCRIHERHGYAAKPLGCKIYPYAIAPTYEGQVSVTGRFDCPAIRENEGELLDRDEATIHGFVQELKLSGGFDEHDLDGLEPATARRLVRLFYDEIIGDSRLDFPARLAAALIAVERLEVMGATFLNETDLELILPSFAKRVKADLEHQRIRRLSVFEKWRFLGLLSGYIRRDEELVGRGAVSRLRRSGAIAKLFFGRVNLRDFGEEHPDLVLRRELLFGRGIQNIQQVDFGCYESLLKVRLQAHQFMGQANFQYPFFDGLRSLFVTFPLVLAMAKCHAMGRGADPIRLLPEDLDYAVGAIDHSYGRATLLGLGTMRTITRQVADSAATIRLVHSLSAEDS